MRSPTGHNGGGNNNFRRNNNNGSNGGGQNRNRPHNNGSNNAGRRGGSGGNGNQPQNLRNQIFDSHGPNGERVRGNAFQVHEKYLSLAREAEERIDQENYYQHAEHYYRIVEAIQDLEAEQRSRFNVVENADPVASNGSDPFSGEQPDLAPSNQQSNSQQGESASGQQQGQLRGDRQEGPERQERQPRQDRAERPDRQERQPRARRDDSQNGATENTAPSEDGSGPMFSLKDEAPQAPEADGNIAGSDDGTPTDEAPRRRPSRRPISA